MSDLRRTVPVPEGRASIRRDRNDIRQYDDLVDHWWRRDGAFAALHWLAVARGGLVPPASGPGAVLVDVGCGGGLLAAHVAGYLHVGLDLTRSALEAARSHGVRPVRADVVRIPLRDGCADVVVAGEILEHVADVEGLVGEICRVLRPEGTVVVDTINHTRLARFALVTVAERLPGGPPPRIHDPSLFVDQERLRAAFASGGVRLGINGLRPSVRDYFRFLRDRRRMVRMLRCRSVGLVYQGAGTKGPA